MSKAEELTKQFEELIDFVREAADNVGKTDIDVAALGLKAGHLCEAVEGENPAIAQVVRPLMAQLIQDLDGLAMKLEQQKEDT